MGLIETVFKKAEAEILKSRAEYKNRFLQILESDEVKSKIQEIIIDYIYTNRSIRSVLSVNFHGNCRSFSCEKTEKDGRTIFDIDITI